MSIATQLPTEKRVLQDEQTGAAIWQLTNAPCVNHAAVLPQSGLGGRQPRHAHHHVVSRRRAQSLRHPVAGRHIAAN